MRSYSTQRDAPIMGEMGKRMLAAVVLLVGLGLAGCGSDSRTTAVLLAYEGSNHDVYVAAALHSRPRSIGPGDLAAISPDGRTAVVLRAGHEGPGSTSWTRQLAPRHS